MRYTIGYGKRQVPIYRVHARPLEGITPIPESPFRGRSNTLFALEVDIEVLGDNFLPAYTEGDNSSVVATDSMKNFILRESLAYDGATTEGLLHFLGGRFLTTYPVMHALRMTGRELPFLPSPVPGERGFDPSDVLFAHSRDDLTLATLAMTLQDSQPVATEHDCARIEIRLLKTSGSAFTSFVRDGYTTLPDRRDRPLFIYLDIHWRYGDVADAFGDDPARYVAPEQVRDLAATVFHQFVSESIQHLVHEIGLRLLDRFPQLVEVRFVAQNRTRDPFHERPDDPRVKVYSDPFPAYGEITLTMARA